MAYMQYRALSKSFKIEEQFYHGSIDSPCVDNCIHFAKTYLDSGICPRLSIALQIIYFTVLCSQCIYTFGGSVLSRFKRFISLYYVVSAYIYLEVLFYRASNDLFHCIM